MASVRRALVAAVYAAPWAWLICFTAFTAAVTFKVGHSPRYATPDPKHVAGLCTLYTLTVLLLAPVLLSPIVVGALAGRALLLRRSPPGGLAATAVYVVGMALIAAVFFGDAFGLGSWLMD